MGIKIMYKYKILPKKRIEHERPQIQLPIPEHKEEAPKKKVVEKEKRGCEEVDFTVNLDI